MRNKSNLPRALRFIVLCVCACAMLAPVLAQQYGTPPPAGPGISTARWVVPTLTPTILAVTPDGAYAAVPQGFGLIAIYRTADGTCVRTLTGHAAQVNGLAISPDGSLLASGDVNGQVRLWQMSDGTCLRTCEGESRINSVAFSPDAQLLVTAHTDGVARLWQVSNGMLVRTLAGHTNAVLAVAFSPNGQLIATGSADSTIIFWQTSDGACLRTLSGHTSHVFTLAFSPDGAKLASGGLDMAVRLWQVSDGTLLRSTNLSSCAADAVAFSPDGTLLACGGADGKVNLYQVSDGTTVRTLTGHSGEVHGLAFLGNGQTLLSGANDNSMKLWRVSDGTVLRTISTPSALASDVTISPDGQLLAATSLIGTIAIRRVSDGTLVRTLAGIGNQIVTSVTFSPDGQTLATSHYDKTVRLWRVSDGKLLFTLSGHTDALRGVLFTQDGQTLITAGYDTTIKYWRVSDGTLLRTVSGGTDAIYSLALSPDGQTLATGSGDATIKLWRVSDGSCLRTLTGHISYVPTVAFSPDGQTLVSGGGEGTIKFWRLSDGLCLRTLTSPFPQINSLAFSPDGQTLAEANFNKYVTFWNVSDGTPKWTQRGMNCSVNAVTYLPDGNTLAMAGQDGVALWRAKDSQPDLQIRLLSDTSYLGEGIYHQAVSQTAGTTTAGATVSYVAKLVNNGPVEARYLLNAPEPTADWTVRYFDAPADGTDITLPMTIDPGWGVTLAPGQARELRIEVTPTVGLPDPSSYTLQISATGLQDSDVAFAATTLHKVLGNLSLGVSPAAPQTVNTPITLTATSTGGSGVQYQFLAGYQDATGWHWSNLTDYQTTATFTWTPDEAHEYTLQVYAREQGSTNTYDEVSTATYRVYTPLSAVGLVAVPATPQVVGTPIALTATPTGGLNVEYKFRAGYQDATGWHWSELTDYQAEGTFTWTPNEAHQYSLQVYAREQGSANAYDVMGTATSRSYSPLSMVSLASAPAAPQATGVPIALTATPTGGLNVEFKFRAGYQDAAGWHWSELTDYQSVAGCTWTPNEAHQYTLQVYAREQGSDNAYDLLDTATYRIYAPLSAASLAVSPDAPQVKGTPITLTAFTTGGLNVEYKFRAGYQDTAGWHWSDLTNYQAAATCTWTPSVARLYTLLVYVREQGSTRSYEVMNTVGYRISPSITAVTLAAAPLAPQVINTAMTLTATPTGGSHVEYLFRVGYQDAGGWHWSMIRDYATTATCTWTPSVPRLYTVAVLAREQGSTKSYDVLGTLSYRINAPLITAVTLSTTSSASQTRGTAITLTAEATGGYAVEYRFSAGYQDAAGWHWTALTAYQSAATCTWTPADARLYTLVAYTREVGTTVSYQKYATVTYRVTK